MPAAETPSQPTRTRLIQAALSTLESHGLSGLTLDAVAQEAAISKGGLLYHFPSKDALIEALLRHLFAAFAARVQQYVDLEPPQPGRWLRGYVRATFDEDPIPLQLAAMLFVAVIENERLVALIQEDARHWHDRLADDGIPVTRATVVRRAADATWTERMMHIATTGAAARLEVLNELLALTYP